MKEELQFLNEIKQQLLETGELLVIPGKEQINVLRIKSDDWHRIFKTDLFNKLKIK